MLVALGIGVSVAGMAVLVDSTVGCISTKLVGLAALAMLGVGVCGPVEQAAEKSMIRVRTNRNQSADFILLLHMERLGPFAPRLDSIDEDRKATIMLA